jgi:hypothetical protein
MTPSAVGCSNSSTAGRAASVRPPGASRRSTSCPGRTCRTANRFVGRRCLCPTGTQRGATCRGAMCAGTWAGWKSVPGVIRVMPAMRAQTASPSASKAPGRALRTCAERACPAGCPRVFRLDSRRRFSTLFERLAAATLRKVDRRPALHRVYTPKGPNGWACLHRCHGTPATLHCARCRNFRTHTYALTSEGCRNNPPCSHSV